MKKVNFVGEFSDVKVEGLMKIVSSLEKNLLKDFSIKINSNKKFDLLNIHSAGFLPALKKRKTINVPIIYSLHTNFGSNFFQVLKNNYDLKKYILDDTYSYHTNFFQRSRKLLFKLLSISYPTAFKKLLFKKYSKVIVPNYYMKKKLNYSNVEVIRHGINIEKFIPKKIPHKKIAVSYIGHLGVEKGIIEAVYALSSLDDTYTKSLFLTGKTDKFLSFVKSRDENISIYGTSKNIVKTYQEQDIIILPFRNEVAAIGTPLVLIEAMATGKAIITTNLQHLKEYCSDSVLYVEPYDTKDLISKLNQLVSDPKLRKELGIKARLRAETYFDEKVMIEKYTNMYNKLLMK